MRAEDTVGALQLLEWVSQILNSVGFNQADASFIATTLVDANLRGIDSHGVIRLPIYVQRVRAGLVNPGADPQSTVSGAVAHVSGQLAAGQLSAKLAMQLVTELASKYGVACVTVRESAHFGAAGFYARWIASQNCVGVIASNSESIVVPYGGAEAVLGTNPLAVAAPTPTGVFCLDMATSAGAMGKVALMAQRGEEVPPHWAVDENGVETSDPSSVAALMPVGGIKGYGLGLVVEILAGILSGAAIGKEIGNMYEDLDRPQNVGHFMLALHLSYFGGEANFLARFGRLSNMLKLARTAPGFKEVLLPGEPEGKLLSDRTRDGIPIGAAVLQSLQELGEELKLPFPSTTNGADEAERA